jgi:hypothetical protein
VRDLSESGAGLQLNNLLFSPTDFNHLVGDFRNMPACRLIWKDGCFAGIAFVSSVSRQRPFRADEGLRLGQTTRHLICKTLG